MDYSVTPPVACPVSDPNDFDWRLGDEGVPPDPADPNAATARRRQVNYVLTAQTVINNGQFIDTTPATARFSVYVREVEEEVRDEIPIREFGR